jgi:hypothetical protein
MILKLDISDIASKEVGFAEFPPTAAALQPSQLIC